MPKWFIYGQEAEKEIGVRLVTLKRRSFMHGFIYITCCHSASWQTNKPTVQSIGIDEVKN